MNLSCTRRRLLELTGSGLIASKVGNISNNLIQQNSSPVDTDWLYPKHGPDETAFSPNATPPQEGELGEPRELTFKGNLLSEPLVKNDSIFLFTGDGITAHVYSYSMGGSEGNWESTFDALTDQPFARTSASISGSIICVSTEDTYAFDIENGDTVWSSEGTVASSVVGDSVHAFKRGEGLVALDKETGDEVWKTPARVDGGTSSRWVPSTPAVGDGRVYFCRDAGIDALDSNDGTLQWQYESDDFELFQQGIPTILDNRLIVTGNSKIAALDPSNGLVLWVQDYNAPSSLGSAVAGDSVFVGHNEGVDCLDLTSGSKVWEKSGEDTSRPAVADGMVYVAIRKNINDTHVHEVRGLDVETGDVMVRSSEIEDSQEDIGVVLAGKSIITESNGSVSFFTGNLAPTADAGGEQTVEEGATVMLDGTGSGDQDGDSLTYSWTQTDGPDVTLANADSANPEFTAPEVDNQTDLTFELTVDDGEATDTDTTVISITDSEEGEDGPPVIVGEEPPTDVDGDGLYEDIDGDGDFSIVDVQLLFQNRNRDVLQNNAEFFDFSGNNPDEVTIADIQGLFQKFSNRTE